VAFPIKRPGLALIHTVVAVALPALQLPDAGIGADRMKSLVWCYLLFLASLLAVGMAGLTTVTRSG
jgi:hypothetical protein